MNITLKILAVRRKSSFVVHGQSCSINFEKDKEEAQKCRKGTGQSPKRDRKK